MAGIRLAPEDSDISQPRAAATGGGGGELISDDDRSIAADSWSIKSEYGSTLDDEQRHADATEALDAANLPPASDYSSDREEEDEEGEGVSSMLGLQSYWDSAYTNELANFREHGHSGEVMSTVVSWTRSLCIDISRHGVPNHVDDGRSSESSETSDTVAGDSDDLSSWSVLDIGTGNGLLLQELAKQGFSDLTGTDYSEGAIFLARGIAERDGFTTVKLLVDDILETKLDRQFSLVVDKGTLDAIGLHPDGPLKRIMYWDSVSKLVSPGGILVITSCNNTKDELIQEVENYSQREQGAQKQSVRFHYVDHIRSYPTFMFGGVVGTRVATVAFVRN
ncbi:hypothetical protein V2J09_012625 [Rumex salicifolius]